MVSKLFLVLMIASLAGACDGNQIALSDAKLPLAVTPTPQLQSPRLIDFQVSGVRLGDAEEHVLKQLGNPKSRKIHSEDYCGITKILKLKYRGLEIWLDRETDSKEATWTVLELWVDSPDVVIEPGIKIGDQIDDIRSKLGDPYMKDSEAFLFLTINNDIAAFYVKNNRLQQVRLYINPC